jgi:hypothetical protein
MIEHYEDEPSGPVCEHCGAPLDWQECDCEDGFAGHDCGEDCLGCPVGS